MQGKTINGFELKRLLGVGGMAEVWYAENEIGMKAAVKILSDELSRNAQMKERFLNEAKVMVKLDHPNIRKVYGYGSIDERPAIIMEYLDGSDLKAKLQRGQRFSEAQFEKWWNQLVDALNYTHSQSIVHRDIKPSNIFLDKNDDVKLTDFGIAKLIDTTSGTLTGSTLGTRIYMSPEQVKDPKRVGSESDVYSLAVSFVHLLTGKAPYDSTKSSDYDIQVSIVTKPVDLDSLPETWRSFLAPYLEKDPEKRPRLQHFVGEDGTVVEDSSVIGTKPVIKNKGFENPQKDATHTDSQKKSLFFPWIYAIITVALFTFWCWLWPFYKYQLFYYPFNLNLKTINIISNIALPSIVLILSLVGLFLFKPKNNKLLPFIVLALVVILHFTLKMVIVKDIALRIGYYYANRLVDTIVLAIPVFTLVVMIIIRTNKVIRRNQNRLLK